MKLVLFILSLYQPLHVAAEIFAFISDLEGINSHSEITNSSPEYNTETKKFRNDYIHRNLEFNKTNSVPLTLVGYEVNTVTLETNSARYLSPHIQQTLVESLLSAQVCYPLLSSACVMFCAFIMALSVYQTSETKYKI